MTQMTKALNTIGKLLKTLALIIVGFLVLITIVIAIVFPLLNETNGEIVSSGERRSYLLYVPETYDPSTPTPLIIALHGFAEWPAHLMEMSHWNELADEYGFIVVYPAGTGFPLGWRASALNLSDDVPMKDVTFIADLIDELMDGYNIDDTRIYANGMSNGGGMAYLLACKLSDRITAIGGVAGAYNFPPNECHPTRSVPMIVFHGSDDQIVPYTGGESSHVYLLPDVLDWVKAWAIRNECDDHQIELPAKGDASGIKFTNCDQNADVILYTISGGGHSWPGGGSIPQIIVGLTTQDIDATEVMWDFFRGIA